MDRICPPCTTDDVGERHHLTTTRHLIVGCEFTYEAAVATPAVLQVQARPPTPSILIRSENWLSTPSIVSRSYVDIYGNSVQPASYLPAGWSTLRYKTADPRGSRCDRGCR